jgi:flagellar assembly protein FliH
MSKKVVISLNKSKFNLKYDDEVIENSVYHESEEEIIKKQLEASFNKGMKEGYNNAEFNLKESYNDLLNRKYNEVEQFITQIQNGLKEYEQEYEKLVIDTALLIAEKVIHNQISESGVIKENVKESLKKVIGADNILIRLNPDDYKKIVEDKDEIVGKDNYSSVKIEKDENIDAGGCYVESDIGNIDARIASQLTELKRKLYQSIDEIK